MTTIRYPEDLPICARREEIVAAIRGSQVVVVAGETGSGKTTQLPKMCLDAGLAERGKIGCTQPRRVAALSVSKRVAEELGVTWGREVGCKMRFNDDTGRDTQVKFMTDGILLAEIQSDPMLRAYSALILDEAHERSLNIDFLLGYLPGLLRKRPELKLIITSATIDTEAFSQAFGGAPIIEVSGRLWPVEVRYAPSDDADDIDHIEAAVRATEDALIESDAGDVLVFMPTERDIRETRELLEGSLGSGIEVIGLFGRMPAAEQQRIDLLLQITQKNHVNLPSDQRIADLAGLF
ncbi:MAG: DEAD/DEAH box helicase [Chthoniobacteraceae bacterium]